MIGIPSKILAILSIGGKNLSTSSIGFRALENTSDYKVGFVVVTCVVSEKTQPTSVFNQTSIGTVSRATLGRLLRDEAERVWAFPSATMLYLAETETELTEPFKG